MTRPVLGPATLDALYERWIAVADWAHAHRLAVATVGAPVVILVLAGINRFVLLGFPNSGDEYAYLYQAQTLAAGRLWNTPIEPAGLFTFNYIVQEPHRLFGSFPAGWPLALAAASRLGVPTWLLNPILGALTLGLVWMLGARLYGPRAGVSAAALLAASPFFLFNGASYFSHTFCGVMLLGAACVAARDDRRPAWVPLTVGLLVGWAVMARYFTGVVCGVPIVLWLLRPGAPRLRTSVLFVAGGLPWVVVLASYNTVFSGNPWQLTTRAATVAIWFADRFLLRGADILSTHLLRHLTWTPPALLVAYAAYLRIAPRDRRRGLLDWMIVLVAVSLYFYVERGGNQYGPRFHYEAFLFVVVFVCGHLFRGEALAVRPSGERLLAGLMAASVAVLPVSFAVHAVIEQRVIRERTDPYTQMARTAPEPALVMIHGRVGTIRSMAATDLTRNGIDHDGRVLYGLDPGEAGRCPFAAAFPGRAPYLYAWESAGARGVLTRLACP